ncbi:CvpA family protein [Capnocytophaga canimorsus]|uniref:CvpA family protein n=1 Tax=Capnocytophaga canimorsus TaxID=28188 RepID=UPI001561F325|nr:CvpA family protein [Capnocytophaga canimorsus]
MNTIDIILAILLALGLIRGIWRGLIIELGTLLAFVLGIYGAMYFSFYAADALKQYVSWNAQTTKVVAYVLTLMAVMFAVMFLAKLLTKVAKMVALGFVNRALGGIFGVLKVIVILGASLSFFDKTAHLWLSQEEVKKSVLFQPVKDIGNFVYAKVLNSLSETDFNPVKKNTPL